MAAIKTKQTSADVLAFIRTAAQTEQKQQDSLEILKLMQSVTGFEPKMWGSSIIGFGSYHYSSAKSKQEGDWPLVGFSPRKAAISLYVYSGSEKHQHLLKELRNFKMGKACIYIKRFSDINPEALKTLIRETVLHIQSKYGKQ